MSGVRTKISGTLPASLRAGIMTDTEGAFTHASRHGCGLATIKFVNARCLKGQSFTRNRLHTPEKNQDGSGHKISCQCLITSKSVRLSKPAMSSAVSQF